MAERAGLSVEVLLRAYAKCITGQQEEAKRAFAARGSYESGPAFVTGMSGAVWVGATAIAVAAVAALSCRPVSVQPRAGNRLFVLIADTGV